MALRLRNPAVTRVSPKNEGGPQAPDLDGVVPAKDHLELPPSVEDGMSNCSVSRSKTPPGSFRCRYCWELTKENYSMCECRNGICRACLEAELRLTESRNAHEMKCTVCAVKYPVRTLPIEDHTKKVACFLVQEIFYCRSTYNPRPPGSFAVAGLVAVACAVSFWIVATTWSLLHPEEGTFRKQMSLALMTYILLISLEVAVCICALIFVSRVRVMKCGVRAYFGVLYLCRGCYVAAVCGPEERLEGEQDFGALTIYHVALYVMMLTSALAVIVSCCLLRSAVQKKTRRFILRESEVMVGEFGPFRLREREE